MEETVSVGATAIRKISLPDQIAVVMRKEIFTGGYQPGDKLPSERELADKFEISRLTLSKALRLLAQEGWIEISQGRNMVVNDFRTSVGLEVLPDLFLACPEALMNPLTLETIAENTSLLGEQVLLAAARKAKKADEKILLELLSRQTEDLGLAEFYENDFRLGHEFLRICDNLILQMAYNSQVKISRRLLSLGLVKDLPYPFPQYLEINRALIKAVCTGDVDLIKSLAKNFGRDLEKVLKRSLTMGK
jgi:DNA-binding FadR family transcriptional regulator